MSRLLQRNPSHSKSDQKKHNFTSRIHCNLARVASREREMVFPCLHCVVSLGLPSTLSRNLDQSTEESWVLVRLCQVRPPTAATLCSPTILAFFPHRGCTFLPQLVNPHESYLKSSHTGVLEVRVCCTTPQGQSRLSPVAPFVDEIVVHVLPGPEYSQGAAFSMDGPLPRHPCRRREDNGISSVTPVVGGFLHGLRASSHWAAGTNVPS